MDRNVNVTRELDYTHIDYESMRADLKALIPKLTPEWTATGDTDLGIALMNAFSGIADMLSYYMNEQAKETFLPTARLRQSVIDITRQIGYTLGRPKGTSTTLEIWLPPDRTESIAIEPYTNFYPRGQGLNFVNLYRQVILKDAENPIRVNVVQGKVITETFTASGNDLQRYVLRSNNVGEDGVKVLSGENNTEYFEMKKHSNQADKKDRYFRLETDMFDNTTLEFAEEYGGVPQAGETITITYLENMGSQGRISNSIITETSMILPVGTTINQPYEAVNGADKETLESAKRNAPKELRSLWRAVTPEDYEGLLEGYQGVLKVGIADNHTNPDIPIHEVQCTVVTEDEKPMSAQFKEELEAFVQGVKMITTRPIIQDAEYVDLAITAQIYVFGNYAPNEVIRNVELVLADRYSAQKLEIGEEVYMSNIVSTIESVKGVSRAVLVAPTQDMNIESHQIARLVSPTISVIGVV
jgi:hypothetical protein